MSNLRQRRNLEPHNGDKDEVSNIPDEDIQPDAGWNTFFRVAFLVFLVLPAMGLIKLIVLVDSPIEPEVYSLPSPPKLEGVLAPNDHLVFQGRRLYEGKVRGPESIIYDHGHIYTGTSDGKILHIEHGKGTIEVLARLGKPPCGNMENEHTCGRPLGMRFDQDGYLIVLDAYLGMYKINVATGDVHELLPASMKIGGKELKLLNDLDIAKDGTIYFTDTGPFERRNFPSAIMEGSGKGRLFKHDPVANTTEVLLDKLHFANGVQLSKDGSFLLVAETSMCRIMKYHLNGPKQGQSELFVDNLPGTVDNIRRSSSGGFWAVLGMCRHADRFNLLDFLGPYPWLRKQIAKIPTRYFTTFLPKCGMIVELSRTGEIMRSLQDLHGERLQFMSEVEDDAGILYVGSFVSPYIGVVDTGKKRPKD